MTPLVLLPVVVAVAAGLAVALRATSLAVVDGVVVVRVGSVAGVAMLEVTGVPVAAAAIAAGAAVPAAVWLVASAVAAAGVADSAVAAAARLVASAACPAMTPKIALEKSTLPAAVACSQRRMRFGLRALFVVVFVVAMIGPPLNFPGSGELRHWR